jgi:hypothetical protein
LIGRWKRYCHDGVSCFSEGRAKEIAKGPTPLPSLETEMFSFSSIILQQLLAKRYAFAVRTA